MATDEAQVSLLTREGGVDSNYVQRIDQLSERDVVKSSKGAAAAPRFTRAAKTALRVSFWTFLTGCAVWVLRHNDSLPHIYFAYLNGVVIAVVFNVTTNVASTLQSVIQSFVGLTFAVAVCFILYRIPDPHDPNAPPIVGGAPVCPEAPKLGDSTSEDLYQWYCIDSTGLTTVDTHPPGVPTFMAFVVYSFFVAVTLALNVVMPFKTFALVGALNFLMNFANPGVDTTNYMALKWDSVLVVTVLTQLAGSLIAILAMLLPPVTATRSAVSLAATSTKTTAELLLQITTYYCGSHKTLQINVYNSQLTRNRENMNNESKDLDNGWWEFFDWGKFGVTRYLLQDHLKMLKDLDSRLSVMQTAVLREGFEDAHRDVMIKMKEPMLEVVRTTSECLLNCTLCASDGWISNDELTALGNQRTAIDKAIQTMAEKWREVRGDNNNALSAGMRAEGFFLLELSTFGRVVGEFADELQNPRIPGNIAFAALTNIFSREKLASSKFRNFILRNWISLMIAWWWACFANDYCTAVPMNVVFMLTEQPGNSLLMNLQKLQASVLGSLAGTVLYRAFHYCTDVTRLMKLISLFLWEFVSMFIANYSTEYATVGLLLAVYGGAKLIHTCDAVTTNGEVMSLNSDEFRALRFFAYAMCIVSVVDFALRPSPACDQAREKLLAAMDKSFSYVKQYFEGKATVGIKECWEETAKVTDEVLGLLDEAEGLVPSADQEPRFAKCAFRTGLFTDLCKRVRKMQLQAQVLIRRSEAANSGLYQELKKCKSFEAVKADLLRTIDDTQRIAKEVITYDDFGAMDPKLFDDVIGKSGVDQVEDLTKLEEEVKALNLQLSDDAKRSLEYGAISRFAAVFELLEIYVKDLAEMTAASVAGM